MDQFIIDNDIKQIFVSKSIYDKYSLYNKKTNNNLDNALFIGIYSEEDIKNIINYEGTKYLLWCGNDCNPNYENRKQNVLKLQASNVINLSNNLIVNSNLKKLNIDFNVIDKDLYIMNLLVDHIYLLYINDTEIKNYESTIAHNKINLNVEYFLGVNGNNSDIVQSDINIIKDSTLKTFIKIATKYNPKLRKGQIGNILSQIKIIEDAIQKNYNSIMILEPDIIFIKNFKTKIQRYLEIIKENDIIYLGGSQHYEKSPISNQYIKYHKKSYEPLFTNGLFAIIIKKNVFNDYLRLLKLIIMPSDTCMIYLQDKYKSIVCNPNLIIADVSDSSILNGRDMNTYADKFNWHLEDYNIISNI